MTTRLKVLGDGTEASAIRHERRLKPSSDGWVSAPSVTAPTKAGSPSRGMS
jgi:hypothetical protein